MSSVSKSSTLHYTLLDHRSKPVLNTVPDLDSFFTSCYSYYRSGGLTWCLAEGASEIFGMLVGGVVGKIVRA